MGQALRAGKVVQIVPRSLAKTLGSPYVAEDGLTVMQKHPEHYLLMSDKEVFDAGVFLLERSKLNAELAASCTLAAARRLKGTFLKEDHVVLSICGGNNSLENWIHYREILG